MVVGFGNNYTARLDILLYCGSRLKVYIIIRRKKPKVSDKFHLRAVKVYNYSRGNFRRECMRTAALGEIYFSPDPRPLCCLSRHYASRFNIHWPLLPQYFDEKVNSGKIIEKNETCLHVYSQSMIFILIKRDDNFAG